MWGKAGLPWSTLLNSFPQHSLPASENVAARFGYRPWTGDRPCCCKVWGEAMDSLQPLESYLSSVSNPEKSQHFRLTQKGGTEHYEMGLGSEMLPEHPQQRHYLAAQNLPLTTNRSIAYTCWWQVYMKSLLEDGCNSKFSNTEKSKMNDGWGWRAAFLCSFVPCMKQGLVGLFVACV